MDVLSDVLQHLRLESMLLPRPRTFAPWGLAMDASEDAAFHLILGGPAWLRIAGDGDPRELRAGDFVLLPRGDAHTVADAPDSPAVPMAEVAGEGPPDAVAQPHVGGSGRETLAVAGRFRFARHGVHPLLSPLPSVLHVRGSEGWRGTWLEPGVQLLSTELASQRPGSREVVARMLEVLFLQALRCYVEDARGDESNWLLGLRDERVAAALACMHREPWRSWSTARLAAQAGMSRAPFTALFTRLVGETPPHYLTRWRIQTALQALRTPGSALGEVATAVGYPSTAAFTRIFKRMVGMPPAEYRRAAANGHEPLPSGTRNPGDAPPRYAAAGLHQA